VNKEHELNGGERELSCAEREFSAEEQEFIRELHRSASPDELAVWLDRNGPAPSAEALDRIRRRTRPQSAGARRVPFLQSLGARVAAAVLLLVLMSSVAVGPQRVLAGIENLLHYVPGFGAQEIAAQAFLSASQPVIVESGPKRLEILGLFSDGQSTNLRLRAVNVWDLEADRPDVMEKEQEPFLIDADGNEYRHSGYSKEGSGGGDDKTNPGDLGTVEGWYRFAALTGESPTTVTLVIPGHEELTARITLVGTDHLSTLGSAGVTETVQDISVTVVPEMRDNRFLANLVYQLDSNTQISAVGDYPRQKTLPKLTDNTGRVYGLLEPRRSTLLFEPVGGEVHSLALTIPALTVREPGEARVKLPVPEQGESLKVNEEISLGRYRVTVTEVETYRHGLRVYVDLGEPAVRTLLMFQIEPHRPFWQQLGSWGWSWSGRIDEDTGQLIYFEIPHEDLPRGGTVNFILKNPEVLVNGPWEFRIERPGITGT